jgi:hypothetical protein
MKMCFNRQTLQITTESDIPQVTILQQEMQDYSAFTQPANVFR